MKNVKFYLLALAFASLSAMNTSCSKDPEETCDKYSPQCEEALEATLCCEGASCKYNYNGVEYPATDEGRAELAEILCPAASEASLKEVRKVLHEKTLELMEKAKHAAI